MSQIAPGIATTESSNRCSRRRQTSPPVPSPGKLDETYSSSFILAHLLHYVKHDVINKTGST